MQMPDTRCPRQSDDYQVADRESMGGEMVLFHPQTQQILYSNATGALVWSLCDGQRTVDDIVQLLSEAYPDASAEIATDVHESLETFDRYGAIVWA
jgi:hypothetical protein